MIATIALESIPPDKKAPSGTSLIILRSTDSNNNLRNHFAGFGIVSNLMLE
jgi:hypothetical protein